MPLDDYQEHLFQLGEKTFSKLRHQGLAPTVENYAVWFSVLRGNCRELMQEIKELKSQNRHCDETAILSLYEKFIIGSNDTIAEPMACMSETIQATRSILEDASENAATYGGALDQATLRMAECSEDDLKALVGDLVETTSGMRQHTSKLQSELSARQNEIDDLRAELEAAKLASNLDALTGIGNRRFFNAMLLETINEARALETPLSLVMIDIDHFKQFNDNYGHQIGDVVLRLIAGLLTNQVKGRDVVCRYGGEEFVLLLPDTEVESAEILGNKICKYVASQRPRIKSKDLELEPITLSLGAAQWRDEEPGDVLVERADEALYIAKSDGRNCVRSEKDLTSQPKSQLDDVPFGQQSKEVA